VRNAPGGVASYRLVFGVPRQGTAVQVPFPPADFRHFGPSGQAASPRHFPCLQVRPQWPLDGYVGVWRDGHLVTQYHVGPREGVPVPAGAPRRPYFFPVLGPADIPLTDLGKPHDPTGSHAHHYSLWLAHASVAGRDFWSEHGGCIRHVRLEATEDGPLFARVAHCTAWHDDAPYLTERRSVACFAPQDGPRLLDFDLEFAPAGASVELGTTPFGFLAVRVAQSMTVFDGGGDIVNAVGRRNEQGAHLRPAPWIDLSGPVSASEWGGVALLDHPDNPNHPTRWHCRNDGWAGASFNATEPRVLEAGEILRLRYRVLLHRHDAIGGEVARRFCEYAARPAVTVGPAEPYRPNGAASR
jgi:hypothetical protein